MSSLVFICSNPFLRAHVLQLDITDIGIGRARRTATKAVADGQVDFTWKDMTPCGIPRGMPPSPPSF
jgi:hypothetical protein